MKNDVEFYRINGAPTLKKMVYPSRNLTQSDMMLQGKLDKMSWSCFVPSCENQRLMTDKKVVFFPVPDGKSMLICSIDLINSFRFQFHGRSARKIMEISCDGRRKIFKYFAG